MKRYENLEGKIIDIRSQSENIKGRVVGCDYDIGITIVAKNDPGRHLACLNGPSSPLWKNNGNKKSFRERRYRIMFSLIADQIETGVYNPSVVMEKWTDLKGLPIFSGSSETCPFGQ